jgi:hypothetical protein
MPRSACVSGSRTVCWAMARSWSSSFNRAIPVSVMATTLRSRSMGCGWPYQHNFPGGPVTLMAFGPQLVGQTEKALNALLRRSLDGRLPSLSG